MTKLKKELTLIDVFAICTGTMISTGIFVLPGIAYSYVGPAVVLAYLLAGLMYLPAILSYAELSSAMPRSGLGYFCIDRSMGPVAGTIGGTTEWLSLILKSSFALIGIGAFSTVLFPNLTFFEMKLIAAGFCVFFVFINILGIKEASSLQIGMVAVLLGILFLYIVKCFPDVNLQYYSPFFPKGKFSILPAAGLIYISFAGITQIVTVGEEVKNPGKNIPLGMFSAFFVVLLFYTLIVLVTVGIIPGNQLAHSLTPLAEVGRKTMGNIGVILISIAAFLAFATTANAGVMAASRILIPMSRDGRLPSLFKTIHKKFRTPYANLIFSGIVMMILIAFLDIQMFAKTATVSLLVLFILVNISLIVMRESKIFNYQPIFISPLYPYVQIIGILSYVYLLFQLGIKPLITTGIILLVSLVWYVIYARIQITRESALVHVLARFMSSKYDKALDKGNLASELKEIVLERDEIVEDHFDKLVHESIVLDIKESISIQDFFRMVARAFSEKLGFSEKEIYQLLMEREKESTSVIFSGFAMPHIVADGNYDFSLLMARSRAGIQFSSSLSLVHAIFVFIGTKQMRSFYLRSLVAIAEIIRKRNFLEYWKNARTTEELKNIILMCERERVHMIYCLHHPEEVLFEDRVLNKISSEGEIETPMEPVNGEQSITSFERNPNQEA